MAAVGVWGLSPSEFWRMHPHEFWWLYESKLTPEQRQSPDDKWADLYEALD